MTQLDSISTTFKDVHMTPDVLRDLEFLKLTTEQPAQFSHAKMIALSGADIRSKYVGEGEKKISKIFAFARKNHPCIIFIDEADALFRSRSSETISKGHLEDINQFLTEMDGITSKNRDGPIVIAATNRPFDLDEGIMRRLGKRILIDVPDIAAREEILKIQLEGETVAADVDLAELAKATPEYTGSDLKDLVYEAAILAVLQGQRRSHAHPPHASAPKSSGISFGEDASRRVICKAHLIEAKHTIHASPKSETMAKIREFHNKFGSISQGRRNGGVPNFNKTKGVVSK
ncbi:hypothetical protein SLS56_011688 [Neofusicoccum ribis]|uniref:Uncharacterized protein n=1 Tax=Neofusicoccum ribis TaxID=45134 RepID=A0ABR3SAZ0_9PEZI